MTEEKSGIDFDFEKFCTALKAENPDISLIKAGMEKYGTGQLTDSQKEQFLKAMFPEPVITDKQGENGLGFQNMTGIKRALEAMNELKAEEKIGDKEILQLLTEKNSKNGRNVMTTIALNTRAAEFRIAHTENNDIKTLLESKMNDLEAIQKSLGNIDDEFLAQAICTPDDTIGIGEAHKKKVNYADMAERAIEKPQTINREIKDSLLKENYEKVKDRVAEIMEAQKQQETETPSNTDALNVAQTDDNSSFKVGGTQNNPQTLNVEQDVPEDVPDITPAPQEDPSKHGDIKMDRIRECDIIDFMFNDWFLASINWGAEKLVNLANDAIHNAIHPSAPTPTVTAAKGATKNPAAQRVLESHQNTINMAMANGLVDNWANNEFSSQEISDVFGGTLTDVKQFIGKDPKDWKPCKVIDPVRHAKLIERWNAIYQRDPEAFKTLLENRQFAVAMLAPKQLTDISKLAAHYAFLDYASKDGKIEKELSDRAKKKIYAKQKLIFADMLKTEQLIRESELNAYRARTQGLAPDTPFENLPPEAQKEILIKSGKRFGKYLEGLSNDANTYMGYVVTGVTAESANERESAQKKLKESNEKIQKVIAEMGNKLPEEEPVRNMGERDKSKPQDLRKEAFDNNKTEEHEKNVTGKATRDKEAIEGDKEKSNKRKNEFNCRKDKFYGNNTGKNIPNTPSALDLLNTGFSR